MDTFVDPNSLVITPQILKAISEVDEFKGAWKLLSKLTPERLKALKKVATIESIGSSTRIEGAHLSDSQIAHLLSTLESRSLQTRDEQEVAGYAFVCEQICDAYTSIPLTENSIKQLHQQLLQFADKDVRHRGEYKKIPIRIEAFDSAGKSIGILFETTSPLETPIKMRKLVEWTRAAFKTQALHPLIIIGIFVVLFLAIHPFQDGNGRLSRLLTTLLLLKHGYLYTAYSSLESIIEKNKEAYYLALQQTQKSWQSSSPNWLPWLHFFCECLQRQKKHLEIKMQNEALIGSRLPKFGEQILKLTRAQGQLTIGQITALTKGNRNTLKKSLSELVQRGLLVQRGSGKATYYSSL